MYPALRVPPAETRLTVYRRLPSNSRMFFMFVTRPYRSRVGVCVGACARARAWARALGVREGSRACVRGVRIWIKPGRIRSGRIGSERVEGRGSSENGSRHVRRKTRRGLASSTSCFCILLYESPPAETRLTVYRRLSSASAIREW